MNATSSRPETGAAPIARALSAFELLQRVDDLLAPLLKDFTETVPALVLSRHTYDGAWVVKLRTPGRLGDPDFARLEFEISVNPDEDTVSVAVRSTTHNRDHVVQRMTVSDGEVGMTWLSRFFETALLLFVGRFHGPAVPSR